MDRDACTTSIETVLESAVALSLCRDAPETKWPPHTLHCKVITPEHNNN